jgi:exosortase E/protease (VPEID-CTERM system)
VLATAASLARCVLPFSSWAELLWRARKTLGMALVAGTLAWLTGRAGDEAWTNLSAVTLDVSARLLSLVEPEIVLSPDRSLIGTPQFAVTVAPVCSGLAGIGLMAAFFGVFMFAGREQLRLGRVAVLLPISLGFAWLANALRIAFLIVIGSHGLPGVAMSGFHSKAGWFFFCFVALALLFAVWRMPFFLRKPPERTRDTWNPTLVYLAPLIVQLAVAMATGMFAEHVDHGYGLRVLAIAVTLWLVRRLLPPARVRLHWEALALGAVGYAVWIALQRSPDVEAVAAAQRELRGFGSVWFGCWVALRLLGSVVLVPISEELAFRGCLLPRIMDADFLDVPPRKLTLSALAVSSVAFGLMHDNWLGGIACGVLFALARQRRGRLSDAIVAHATTNLLIAGDVLLRGSWWLWL